MFFSFNLDSNGEENVFNLDAFIWNDPAVCVSYNETRVQYKLYEAENKTIRVQFHR